MFAPSSRGVPVPITTTRALATGSTTHIATPMSRYPEYRQSRQSFGINVLGTLVVEIEAEDGTIGFAVTTGGEPACYIVEKHLARFLEGRSPTDL